MSINLEVQAIGGSTVNDVVSDIRQLADKLGIMVHVKFNGTMMMASPGESRDEVRDRFKLMEHAELQRFRQSHA